MLAHPVLVFVLVVVGGIVGLLLDALFPNKKPDSNDEESGQETLVKQYLSCWLGYPTHEEDWFTLGPFTDPIVKDKWLNAVEGWLSELPEVRNRQLGYQFKPLEETEGVDLPAAPPSPEQFQAHVISKLQPARP